MKYFSLFDHLNLGYFISNTRQLANPRLNGQFTFLWLYIISSVQILLGECKLHWFQTESTWDSPESFGPRDFHYIRCCGTDGAKQKCMEYLWLHRLCSRRDCLVSGWSLDKWNKPIVIVLLQQWVSALVMKPVWVIWLVYLSPPKKWKPFSAKTCPFCLLILQGYSFLKIFSLCGL